MRAYIGRVVHQDAQINALGITKASYFSGNADTPSVRPYVVARWGNTAKGMDVSNQRTVTFWVHDTGNDYTKIDAIIARIRALMLVQWGVRTESGWITGVDWSGDSEDLADDVTRTIIRNTSYLVTGSGI